MGEEIVEVYGRLYRPFLCVWHICCCKLVHVCLGSEKLEFRTELAWSHMCCSSFWKSGTVVRDIDLLGAKADALYFITVFLLFGHSCCWISASLVVWVGWEERWSGTAVLSRSYRCAQERICLLVQRWDVTVIRNNVIKAVNREFTLHLNNLFTLTGSKQYLLANIAITG